MIAVVAGLLLERRNTMFWVFILVAALGLVLIKLGTYSVWVTVLYGGLQLALLVIVGLTIGLIWRRVLGK